MKITTTLALATAFVALAACTSNNANNVAAENTEMNATTTETTTTTETNAPAAMNATGNAGATSNTYGNATTNNAM